jgi:hypothetical protein
VNGETGKLQDMTELGVWDTFSVKAQTVKTAIEVTIRNHDFLFLTDDDVKCSYVTKSLLFSTLLLHSLPPKREKFMTSKTVCFPL